MFGISGSLRCAGVWVFVLLLACLTAFGCDSPESGSGKLSLQVAGTKLRNVSYRVTGPKGFSKTGSIDAANGAQDSTVIDGIPAGTGYNVALKAAEPTQTSGPCASSTDFDVTARQTTAVQVRLTCQAVPMTGSVLVNGTINSCPHLDSLSASPSTTTVGLGIGLSAVGSDADHAPGPLTYAWSATGGSLLDIFSPNASLSCTAAGPVTVTVIVSDGDCTDTASHVITCSPATTGSGGAGGGSGANLNAPALDRTVNTTTGSQLQFLYTGSSPVQVGVAPGAIDPTLAAGLSGAVFDRDTGIPISGVSVSVVGQTAYGTTTTRADGKYNLVVNGGSNNVTLNFSVAGYLTGQRQVQIPALQQAVIADLALVPVPTGPTQVISLASSDPSSRLYRAPAVSDASGSRRIGVYFPIGTSVTAGGNSVSSASVRATEFTVGPRGPSAMPADLPPTSAYTYAVELALDEGGSAQFSSPVPVYVDNFLNFPIGTQVPSGYYDRNLGQWVPSVPGRVLKVLGVSAGKAELAADASGNAASAALLSALGISDEERAQLAINYAVQSAFWRVPVSHFSVYDFNPSPSPPAGAEPGAPGADTSAPPPDLCEQAASSSIECETQVLKESVELAGTPFFLEYRSDHVVGRSDRYTLHVPATPHVLPGPLLGVEAEVTVAGRKFMQNFPATPDQTLTLTWDGRDAFGRLLQGVQPATVRLGNVYGMVYANNPYFGAAGDGTSIGIETRDKLRLWGSRVYGLGTWDIEGIGLGGWDLNVHHSYDPIGKTLNLGGSQALNVANTPNFVKTIAGDGTLDVLPTDVAIGPDGLLYFADTNLIRRVLANGTLETYAGQGTNSSDGFPALTTRVAPRFLAFAPDGALLFTDGNRIRRIAPAGDHLVSTFAGTGSSGFSGDGGSATAAKLNTPLGLAVNPSGTCYFSDWGNNRIRRIGTDGVIRTIAGTGANGIPAGTDGPAINATLSGPTGIALAPNGAVYIAESYLVRRIDPDGIIRRFAGNLDAFLVGDGGPALSARIDQPIDLALGSDGSVYLSDRSTSSIRRVDPSGTITAVAGVTRSPGFSGDGGPATAAKFQLNQGYPGIAMGVDDTLYVADYGNQRVRRVSSALPGFGISTLLIPSPDGREIFAFNGAGKHLQTLDAFVRTPTPIYSFGYDAATGYLNSVTDVDGNVTAVQRDTNGKLTAIRAPFGQITGITLGNDGYISTIANSVPETTQLDYYPGGLLKKKTDPRGNVSNYSYDPLGRLKVDADPTAAGGSQTLAYTPLSTGWSVDRTTKLGHTTNYKIETTSLNRTRTITRADGTIAAETYTPDGGTLLLLPDGTQYRTTMSGDPRFGLLAPIVSTTIQTPGGLVRTEVVTRTAALSNSADFLSLTAYSETHTVNGQPFRSTFDPTTRTWTGLSPQGRKRFDSVDTRAHAASSQIDSLLATQFTPDSHGRVSTISTGNRSTSYGYDATSGFLSSVTDALTRQTTLQTDAVGRTKRATYPDTQFTLLGYDLNGNLSSVTPPGSTAHALDHTAVDLLGLYTPPALSGISTPQTAYTYNADRQLTLITRPDGLTVDYGFDAKGRPQTTTLPTGTITTSYDPTTGKVTTVAGPYGETITLGYDGPLPTTTSWSGPVSGSIARSYDSNFRLKTETINSNPANTFGYDNDDLLTGVGALTVTRHPTTGLLSTATLATMSDTATYDTFGGLANYTTKTGATTLFAITITPDALGRVSHKDETIGGTLTGYDYTYDTRGRLTDVKKAGVLVSHYDYDANGNRLAGPTSGAIGTYDAQDRLKTYNGATYTYGANGELKTKTVGSAVTTYTYDVLGNLTSVALPGGSTTVSYITDGKNRRVGKKVNGTLVKGFLYRDQLGVAAELDGSNQVVSIFLYGTKMNTPDVMLRGGKTYRVISDQVGSVRLVVDSANGAIAQRIDYDEFGRVANDTNVGFQPFGFGGGLYDADTGLVRFGARDYDPVVGRWISKDPILFDGGQANLYVYVDNDPVNGADPAGTGPREIWKCIQDGYSLSECLDDERKVLCKNWGIACDGDTPLPPGRPAFPPGPKEPGPGECKVPDESNCIDRFVECTSRISKSDGTKGHSRCRECMIICEGQGSWPSATGDGRACP
jgi:RHS repeat-associated protein